MSKCIAIIPARGGSKRIPRKNIKPFLGKPIIAYSIESALQSKLFDEVMVSTDDDEIAKIALHYGANVPFMRSKKNANDFATTFDVLEEVLGRYSKYEYAACIYPTAPFVTTKDLKSAFELLISKRYDSVFPVIKYGHPIERALEIEKEQGSIKMIKSENLNKRSQDLNPAYHDAGQFYFFKIKPVSQAKKLFTSNTGAIIVDENEAQDIDTLIDWKMAELKYKLKHEIP